jgi:hypothetical protein
MAGEEEKGKGRAGEANIGPPGVGVPRQAHPPHSGVPGSPMRRAVSALDAGESSVHFLLEETKSMITLVINPQNLQVK